MSSEPSSENRRGKKKKRRVNIVPTVLCALVAVAAIAAAVFLMLQNTGLKKENDAMRRELAKETYTAEEVRAHEDVARAEGEQAAENALLELFRNNMSSGDKGPVDTLRSLMPEQIILAYRNKYIFQEIDPALSRNTFSESDFEEDEDGRLQYVGADGSVRASFGIDVSSFQGEIDWEAVADDGVSFAFIRAGFRGWGGDGSYNVDPYFEDNITGAYDNGIEVGVYWVTHAINDTETREEIDFFREIIDPYREMITLPVVWDLETPENAQNRIWDLPKERLTENALIFMEEMQSAGYRPMFYGNLTSFVVLVDAAQILDRYPVWYAWYSQPLYFPYSFDIWQYGFGAVDGVDGEVDLNLMLYRSWE